MKKEEVFELIRNNISTKLSYHIDFMEAYQNPKGFDDIIKIIFFFIENGEDKTYIKEIKNGTKEFILNQLVGLDNNYIDYRTIFGKTPEEMEKGKEYFFGDKVYI